MTWKRVWQAAVLVISFVTVVSQAVAQWQPPLGIPSPSFGINEVAPALPKSWTSDVPGFYYVQSGGANPGNGYPGNPRAKIPSPLEAGSVVILAGEYSGSHGGRCSITANGTQAKPVYIRSMNATAPSVITQNWEVCGSYYIIENIKAEWPNSAGEARLAIFGDHGVVRHTDLRGDTAKRIGGLSPSGNHHVIWDNHLHDFGDIHATYDQDNHCISIGDSTHTTWIIDNELARCSGDGVQLNGSTPGQIHHIYIGRNKAHHNKQTGLWTKKASDIIFSENIVYGHRPSNSSGGAAMGFQYGPSMVWFLANRVYDNEEGFAGASSNGPGGNAYFINNVIYDINTPGNYDVNDAWHTGQAFRIWGEGNMYFVNNTVYGTQGGIAFPYRNQVFIANNIFASLKNGAHAFVMDPSSFSANSVENNIFESGSHVRVGDSNYTIPEFQAALPGKVKNNIDLNPGFINDQTRDFHLKTTSPAVNAGVTHSVYQTFLERYGIDISRDAERILRPQGSAFDIGAYEAHPEGAVPPASPTALLVQ